MRKLLHIYDGESPTVRAQAMSRTFPTGMIVKQYGIVTAKPPPYDSLEHLLDFLLISGVKMDKILFETPGVPGMFGLGSFYHDKSLFTASMSRGFDKILLGGEAKIYFTGSNIAEGKEGWEFLEAVADALVPSSQTGKVMGHTSVSLPTPFMQHTIHLTGSIRTVEVGIGHVKDRLEKNDVF